AADAGAGVKGVLAPGVKGPMKQFYDQTEEASHGQAQDHKNGILRMPDGVPGAGFFLSNRGDIRIARPAERGIRRSTDDFRRAFHPTEGADEPGVAVRSGDQPMISDERFIMGSQSLLHLATFLGERSEHLSAVPLGTCDGKPRMLYQTNCAFRKGTVCWYRVR
ncbi:MAG: hypothetical protein ACUVSW_06955, partial [Roseiflexus sp.]